MYMVILDYNKTAKNMNTNMTAHDKRNKADFGHWMSAREKTYFMQRRCFWALDVCGRGPPPPRGSSGTATAPSARPCGPWSV